MDAVAGHTTQPCERQRPMAMADAGRRIGAGSWRASPSTSTWGTNRSSHRGNHQFLSPRSSMEAGTRTVLTMVASIKIAVRSEEHTSELQSLMRISYAVFCLKKKTSDTRHN